MFFWDPGRAITIKWQREKRFWKSFHVSISAKASPPRMKKKVSFCLSWKNRMVSMEKDLPGLESSRSLVEKWGLLEIASFTISSRCFASMIFSVTLWGGMEEGMKMTSSNWKACRISSAPLRWPRWTGLKVPPNNPILLPLESFLIDQPSCTENPKRIQIPKPEPILNPFGGFEP